jgi:hypothetical protein
VAGAAFQKFLRLSRDPGALRVTIDGLVWGVVSPTGRNAVMEHYGFADVLSVEDMLRDMSEWQPQEWADWVNTRRRWTDEMFAWLAYPDTGQASPA